MIYYATKETLQRYKLKTPEQFESEMAPFARAVVNRERGNRLFEWGCKLFYFDRRKCLQIMHFETKLVIFLVDLKVKDLECVGDAVAHYLLDLYALSKCDYLVGPMNGGVQMALNWNGNRYSDVHIIDLGTY